MKEVFLTLLTTFLLISAVHAVENPWNNKLPFEEATISYEMAGHLRGPEKVYVRDFGATTAAYRTEPSSKYVGTKKTIELTLTTPDWIFIIDLSANSGSKQINPNKIIQNKFSSLTTAEQKKLVENSEKLGITVIGEMIYNLEKNVRKLLGYDCDKVTAMGITAYTLAGTDFPMKVSRSLMGISEAVVNIEIGKVNEAKFTLPAGATIYHDERSDEAIRDQIDVMFTSMIAGQRPPNVRHQKAAAEMLEAMRMMQQLQKSGAKEEIKKPPHQLP